MPYWVNHLKGESESEILINSLLSLYNDLPGADEEHTDVSLTHESEWCLSAYKSGLRVWENAAGDGDPKHMKMSPKRKPSLCWGRLQKETFLKSIRSNGILVMANKTSKNLAKLAPAVT